LISPYGLCNLVSTPPSKASLIKSSFKTIKTNYHRIYIKFYSHNNTFKTHCGLNSIKSFLSSSTLRLNQRLKCIYFTFIYLFLLLAFGCKISNEKTSEVIQVNSFSKTIVTMEHLFGVAAHGSKSAWIVGSEGIILHTSDGGINWETQKAPVESDLYDACFVDDQTGWVVGKFGIILHTIDGGKSWEKQTSDTKNRLFSVHFINRDTGWTVGTMGTILHTTDAGNNWIKQGVGEDKYYNAVFFVDGQRGWIVGEASVIYHTEDAGNSWIRHECKELIPKEQVDDFPPPPPQLYDVFFSNATTGWATGMDGVIIKTDDGGKGWKKLQSTAAFSLFKIFVVGDKGWAIGERGQYLVSTDGGNSWEKQEDAMKTRFWLRDMIFTDVSHGWVVGASGTIASTDNGGRNWKNISGIFIQ